MMKELFKGGYVISGQKEAQPVQADLLVDDGKIVKIGLDIEDKDAKVIDVKGQYLIPGLINMHAHLFGTGKPSKNLGAKSKSQEMLVGFIHSKLGAKVVEKLVTTSVRQELYSGVTSLRSVGDFSYSDVIVRDKVNAGKLPGPHMYVSGAAITVPGGHGYGTFADAGTTPEELKALVDDRAKHKVDWIKLTITGGVMDAKKKGAPGELKMSCEQAQAICEEAHKFGYRVASHTESPAGMKAAIEAGVDTLEHSAAFDEKDQAILKARNGALILTFSPALPLYKLPPKVTKLNDMCVYNSGIIMTNMIQGGTTAMKAGIHVGLGTDASCPFCAQYGMWREIWYYWKMMGGTTSEALYRGTLANAEILGVSQSTGSLEEGKNADIVVLKDNPLADLKALSNPEMVVKDGQIYTQKPHHSKFIDENLAEVMKMLEAEKPSPAESK